MKHSKKIISCVLATVMAMQGSSAVFASEIDKKMKINNKIVLNKNNELHINKEMTLEQKEFMLKMR